MASYEQVAQYPVDPEKRERLFALQSECSVVWTTRDGWPVGVIHRFVWRDGRIWVTCSGQRARVAALRARPKSCVIVTSEGTELGREQTVTLKTLARIRDDRATKDWFYPALAAKLFRKPERQEWFRNMLDTPRRVVLELVPTKEISYDGTKLAAAIARDGQAGVAGAGETSRS